jgi:hypothetical protein
LTDPAEAARYPAEIGRTGLSNLSVPIEEQWLPNTKAQHHHLILVGCVAAVLVSVQFIDCFVPLINTLELIP